jgi:ubiquinone/menaquinone biosynthesis C-methylase UbiE
MAQESSPSDNTYIIDIESGAETARLIEQDKLFTQAMGGLFPEQADTLPDTISSLLDIACGPGGWATNVAYKYPHIEVMGIDINTTMIHYASAIAQARGIKNVSFEVMDAKKSLAFNADSFDFVNARLTFGFMDKMSWPPFIAECLRILKPGGILRLTELEFVTTNSLALQRLTGYLYQILSQQNRTFSVDGRSFGMIHMLDKLLRTAGFQKVEKRPFLLDASLGSDLYYSTRNDYEVAYALLRPYMIQSGIVDEATFDDAYNTTFLDMIHDDFASVTTGFTTWGMKSLS